MAEIIQLDILTKCDISADRVLEAALDKLEGVVITGFDKNGDEYFASSYADGGDALWLLEKCKQNLLNYDEGE